MDVSLAQFGRILKNVWKEDRWVENHLSSRCIFGFVLCCGERCSFGRNKWLLCPLWGPSTYNSTLLLFLKTHLLQDFIAPFFRQTCISHFSPRNICIFLLFLFCSQTCTCILWRGSFQRCKQIQGWSWEFPRRGLRKKEYVRCKKCEAKYFLNFQKCFPDLCKYFPDQKIFLGIPKRDLRKRCQMWDLRSKNISRNLYFSFFSQDPQSTYFINIQFGGNIMVY